MIKNNEIKTTVVSLLSGKGGVGKTAVAGSMAYLLSEMGYSVLLIDCDLATYGLSCFFMDEIEKQKCLDLTLLVSDISLLTKEPIELSGTEWDVSNRKSDLAEIGKNLWLLPSFSQFTGRSKDPDGEKNRASVSRNIYHVLERLIQKFSLVFDFIILDSQAGYSQTSRSCLRLSNITLMVLEADPVGMWAVNKLERRLAGSYPNNIRTYYLINKLFLEEVQQYKSMTNYLRLISHLPPLPFDFEVRKSFARRKIPIDMEHPTAFLISLIRLLPELFPQLEKAAAKIEEELVEKAFAPIEIRIKKIESQIKEIRLRLEQMKERQFKWRVITTIIPIAVMVSFTVLFIIGNVKIEYFMTSLLIFIFIELFLSMGGFGQLAELFTQKRARNEIDEKIDSSYKEILSAKLDDLIRRRRSLDELLFTKSEKLLFPILKQISYDDELEIK
jgi:cellulose biosynthesis protein BcsQ